MKQKIIGRKLGGIHYIHKEALEFLSPEQHTALNKSIALIEEKITICNWNLCKISKDLKHISLLQYEDFKTHLFPCLQYAQIVHLETKSIKEINYKTRENPPVLHRQELMLHPQNENIQSLAKVTELCEQNGLFEKASYIGTKVKWEQRLKERGYKIQGLNLVKI